VRRRLHHRDTESTERKPETRNQKPEENPKAENKNPNGILCGLCVSVVNPEFE
jgi:hypothetical protein